MKKTLLTALMVLFAVAAFAQKGSVTATLVDADTGDEVIGAVLTLTPSATPDKKQYATSAYKGLISFPSLSYSATVNTDSRSPSWVTIHSIRLSVCRLRR